MRIEPCKGWDLDFCYSVTLGDTQGYVNGTLEGLGLGFLLLGDPGRYPVLCE
jgi:hypothetical protein